MKTLIVYGSTYGYTKDCVEKLTKMLKGEVTAADAEKDSIPNLAGFDTVIAGGSIYMGRCRRA
jgi:menaquinone-dependent protoporphyrinogen oxidase